MPTADAFGDEQLAVLEKQIDAWLEALRDEIPQIAAIDRGEDDILRWYVRLRGDEKDFITVWLTLGQRTLRFEAHVMPAPEENIAAVFEQLLRRNDRLVGAHFSIGHEDAVYLRGDVRVQLVDQAELDRIIGTVYATVENVFRPLLRLGFASHFG